MTDARYNNSRVSYDKHFVAYGSAEHDGKQISGISLFFVYKYFVYPKQHKGEIEVLFPESGKIQPNCFYTCSYNKANGYVMELNEKMLKESLYSRVEYAEDREFCGATIWYEGDVQGYPIPYDTALSLLKNNPQAFDNVDNKSTQNLACGMVVVKKNK